MYVHHLPVLVCAGCGSGFRLEADQIDGGWVEEGSLRCEGCKCSAPIRSGIPRFSGDDYARNFSTQWKQFVELERFYDTDSHTYYSTGLGLTPADMTGKRVLEIGCGSGRGVGHFLAGSPTLMVAIDLSEAVDVVAARFRHAENLLVLQGDMARLPLRKTDFDVVYSYGVLHHTPDPPEYFAIVSEYVAPSGKLATYLYRRGTVSGLVSRWFQKNSHRVPRWLLVSFCWFLTYLSYGLYLQSKLPAGTIPYLFSLHMAHFFFRISPSRHFRLNYLLAHDFHTTRYVFEYEPWEVYLWYERAGFVDMRPLRGCGMIGRKP